MDKKLTKLDTGRIEHGIARKKPNNIAGVKNIFLNRFRRFHPILIAIAVGLLIGWIFKVPNIQTAERLRRYSSMWKKDLALQQFKNEVYFFGDYFLFNIEYAIVAGLITVGIMYFYQNNIRRK